MKMSRRQLNEVISNYLLSEADFGSFDMEVGIEFCDLSKLPKIFTAIFEPMRDRDTKSLKKTLSEELAKSKGNPKRVAVLEKRIKELESPDYWQASDAFAGVLGSGTFMGLTKLLGPGLTLMTMMTKVDCDHIINMINIFTVNILAPLLGIEGSQLKELQNEIDENNAERNKESERQSGEQAVAYSPEQQMHIFKLVSTTFKDNNLLNYTKRNEARTTRKLDLSKYDGKITDVHLDFFELFSPIEYEIFLDDPEADIPESAKENFVNAIQMLEDHGHRDFSSFISTFVLATPGTRTDSAVAKILKAANLKDYFEKPQDATRFVKSIFNTLYKNLEFEGFQMFGL